MKSLVWLNRITGFFALLFFTYSYFFGIFFILGFMRSNWHVAQLINSCYLLPFGAILMQSRITMRFGVVLVLIPISIYLALILYLMFLSPHNKLSVGFLLTMIPLGILISNLYTPFQYQRTIKLSQ